MMTAMDLVLLRLSKDPRIARFATHFEREQLVIKQPHYGRVIVKRIDGAYHVDLRFGFASCRTSLLSSFAVFLFVLAMTPLMIEFRVPFAEIFPVLALGSLLYDHYRAHFGRRTVASVREILGTG